MSEITCHVKDCLNNKHNKCTANAIILGGKGNCKSKSFERNVINTCSVNNTGAEACMGVRHSLIPGALKVLQIKNILRGSSEPREIAS